MRISWRHDGDFLETATLEKKIEVFEAQIWGWQLHIADLIVNGGPDHEGTADVAPIPHSAFAALQVALVYFETIAKYETGYTGRDSQRLFVQGAMSVFPELRTFDGQTIEPHLKVLYEGARCGLYHLSMTAPGIILARTGTPLAFSPNPQRIAIDPHVLIPRLKGHFKSYIARLRDPTNTSLRLNFEKCFDHTRGVFESFTAGNKSRPDHR